MKTFRQLCFSILLIAALVAPALGGETACPPGETQTPPAVLGETNGPPGNGETNSQSAPGETNSPPAIASLMSLVQTWLSAI
jgi:hypothetical protein